MYIEVLLFYKKLNNKVGNLFISSIVITSSIKEIYKLLELLNFLSEWRTMFYENLKRFFFFKHMRISCF